MQQLTLVRHLKKYMAVPAYLLCCACCLMVNVGTADAQRNEQATNSQAIIADLTKRVKQLEEQMVDMQVITGTLESLAQGQRPKSGTTTNSTQSFSQPRADAVQNSWSNSTTSSQETIGGFGETTVSPGRLSSPSTVSRQNLPNISGGQNSSDPQAEYEAAYGFLLQQDYTGAQTAFSQFVQRHPKSVLAGNAQYWLGETFYLQGQYKNAAGAFLKGYQTYGSGAKAPDSLLKLAMSLDRLGQRSAACASLKEISSKYPSSPQHLQLRAKQEIRRLRC